MPKTGTHPRSRSRTCFSGPCSSTVTHDPTASWSISELLAHAAAETQVGRPMTVAEALGHFAGKRVQDVLAAAEAVLRVSIPPAIAEQAGQRLLERLRRELKPIDGVRAAIEALSYRRCVASSSPPERIRISLEATGLAPLFGDHVFNPSRWQMASRRLIYSCGRPARSAHRPPTAS